jgi:hypothetical protein
LDNIYICPTCPEVAPLIIKGCIFVAQRSINAIS